MAAALPSSNPRDLARAVEDLRAPFQALQMAASGIAASMHANTADSAGVYFLLEAVSRQFDQVIGRLESLTESRP